MNAKLRLKSNMKTVSSPKRPVLFSALHCVEEELSHLTKIGVIQFLSYAKWAALIVVVRKQNGTVRLCADFFTGLNASLEDNHHPLLVSEDIFATLNDGKFFVKLDLSDAHLQVEVKPDCRELLTINTHRDLYKFTRLSIIVKTVLAIFQSIMDNLISGLEDTVSHLDYILVVGQSDEELQSGIESLLKRIKEYCFQLQPEKCGFFLKSIKYLGFIFDSESRYPDPENIRAIVNMPLLTDVTTLLSFLGLISYYFLCMRYVGH